ncbi:MAG: sulfurtransferase TusA family protein [Dehalococcoidales bacterium]|jgi:tRNA 2-thiouridine synthesizing protein A
MTIEIDVRGYSCPVPVVKTKKVIEENPGKEIKILIDTQTAVQNVTRLGKHSGYNVAESQEGNDYILVLKPPK